MFHFLYGTNAENEQSTNCSASDEYLSGETCKITCTMHHQKIFVNVVLRHLILFNYISRVPRSLSLAFGIDSSYISVHIVSGWQMPRELRRCADDVS